MGPAPQPGPVREEATTFLRTCAVELDWSRRDLRARMTAVLAEIDATGTYRHTPPELTIGAKLAWRNHTRCIGQLYWRTLTVRDRRDVSTVDEMATELDRHLQAGFNGGNVKPVITVFAPDTPTVAGPRILSPQLVRYAGYRQADGTVIGDPANADLTERLVALGWSPGCGRFDRLPVLLMAGDGSLTYRDLDPARCPDVRISHPGQPWVEQLDLRWYAFPTVSDMRLEIGGVSYPATPFTGWYVATEIGARNFGDVDRYNLLPAAATLMGLDTTSNRTLWKDRALIELNEAVLSSFAAAGVRMLDHHAMTDQFHRYAQARRRGGEVVHAEWSWIVPPMAGSSTPVYHDNYDESVVRPNFFRD
jgi:nitric-oxide synthase